MTEHPSNHGLCIAEVYFSLIVKKFGVGCPGPVQDPSMVLGSKVLLSYYFSVVFTMRLLFHGPDGGSSLWPHSHVPAVGREQTEKEPPLF